MIDTKNRLTDYVVVDIENPNMKADSICSIAFIQVKDNKIVIDGLTKDSEYTVKVFWTLKGSSTVYNSGEKVYHTAKVHAYVYQVEFEMKNEGTLFLLIKVRDPENLMVGGKVTVDGVTKTFVKQESVVSFEGLDSDKEYDVLIVIDSKLEGDINFSKEFSFVANEQSEEPGDGEKNTIKIDWEKVLRTSIIAIAAFLVVCISYFIQKRNMKREEARKYLENLEEKEEKEENKDKEELDIDSLYTIEEKEENKQDK